MNTGITEIRYSVWTADDIGEQRHPETVIIEFAKKNNLIILKTSAHPIGDCWLFEVKGNIPKLIPPQFEVLESSIIKIRWGEKEWRISDGNTILDLLDQMSVNDLHDLKELIILFEKNKGQ